MTASRSRDGYTGGGVAGRVYQYIGDDRDDIGLGAENYADAAQWVQLDKLKISVAVEGESWVLVAPNGDTYLLTKDGDTLTVSRSTINAISAAASLAAGFGGSTGAAISGAGAVSQNVVPHQDERVYLGEQGGER